MAKTKLSDIINTPGIHQIFVQHDDWCLLLLGYGDCNCSPTYELMTVTDDNIEQIAKKISDAHSSLNKFRRSKNN